MKLRYKLYLDDLRPLPDLHPDWRLARNFHDATWYVKNYGVPYHISFDHDLADVHYNLDSLYGPLDDFMDGTPRGTGPREYTGYDFAKWFCMYVMDNNLDLSGFTFAVHSANPVGAKNIQMYMDNFMRDRYV